MEVVDCLSDLTARACLGRPRAMGLVVVRGEGSAGWEMIDRLPSCSATVYKKKIRAQSPNRVVLEGRSPGLRRGAATARAAVLQLLC